MSSKSHIIRQMSRWQGDSTLSVYVDNIMVIGNNDAKMRRLKEGLAKEFVIKHLHRTHQTNSSITSSKRDQKLLHA